MQNFRANSLSYVFGKVGGYNSKSMWRFWGKFNSSKSHFFPVMLHLKVIGKFYFPIYTLAVEEFSFMIKLAKKPLKTSPF